MIQTFPSPLENLAAFALTFVVGIVATAALRGYVARVRETAQAHGCRYPSEGCTGVQQGCVRPCASGLTPATTAQEVGKP